METATGKTTKAFKHGTSVAIDIPEEFGIKPGDALYLEQDGAGALLLTKAASKESISHFSTAATKLTAAQKKATDAWAAQLERDRIVARKASEKADRELGLQMAQLQKPAARKTAPKKTAAKKTAAKKKAKRR